MNAESSGIIDSIAKDVLETLLSIKLSEEKSRLWIEAMNRVEFEDWFQYLMYVFKNKIKIIKESSEKGTNTYAFENEGEVLSEIKKFSSGQKIFLLTISKLILEVTERTVVFIDEPELFLHPPLIKAYVRLISEIITSKNGLGFLITHSPITIQEFPGNCVKIASRDFTGVHTLTSINFNTFGESISIINDELFNIGLRQTGYYDFIERLKLSEKGEKNLKQLKDISGSEARLLISLFFESEMK